MNVNALIDPAFPVRSGVANSCILKSYLALLCMGKSDFDAIESFRDNAFFKRALGLAAVPSSPTLRQRMDAHAASWFELAPKINHLLLASRINGQAIDFGALECGYTPVDLDTFAMDKRFMKSYSVIDQQKSNVYFSPKPVSISSTSASRVCASRDLKAIHSYFILCQSFSMRFSSGL